MDFSCTILITLFKICKYYWNNQFTTNTPKVKKPAITNYSSMQRICCSHRPSLHIHFLAFGNKVGFWLEEIVAIKYLHKCG